MSCTNCANTMYQKSSVDAYTQANQTVAAGIPISFANGTVTGCSIQFTPGSTSFKIVKPGLYLVNFSAFGVQAGTTGSLAVQMLRNGVSVPGALSAVNSSSATDTEPLAFSKIVQVAPSCPAADNSAVLTFANTGVAATYNNVQVTIVKLA